MFPNLPLEGTVTLFGLPEVGERDRTVSTDLGALNVLMDRHSPKLRDAVDAIRDSIKAFDLAVARPHCFLSVHLFLVVEGAIRRYEENLSLQIALEMTYRGRPITFDHANDRLNNSDAFSEAIYHGILERTRDWKQGSGGWMTEAELDALISGNIDKINTGLLPTKEQC